MPAADDRATNDRRRTTLSDLCVVMSPELQSWDAQMRGRVLAMVAAYDVFDDNQDDTHEWGAFIFAGYQLEWWIAPPDHDAMDTRPTLTLYCVADLLRERACQTSESSTIAE